MKIDIRAAADLYASLPPEQRLATLSPDYVEADASRQADLQAVFWCYREGEHFWYHGFHLTPLPDVPGFDIQSPYGYGGPLANCADPAFLGRAWAAYVDAVRAQGVAAEFVRFHPLARNERFYGGETARDRDTVWVDLRLPAIAAGYQTRVRTAVRKASNAGLRFAWAPSADIPARFAGFYRAAMAALSAAKFYYFEDAYFESIAKMPAARLAVCSRGDEWLCAALFLFGGSCVEYHLAASSDAGKRLSASNLLLHEAAESCKVEGYAKLYLGGGTDRSADNSLLFFKSGFSSNRELFRVGWSTHDAPRYGALRDRWPDLHAANPDKIMFYR